MVQPVELAKRIKELCEQNNISINKMLTDSDAGTRLYYNLLGGSYPSVEKIIKIANYFGITVDYFLTGEKNESVAQIGNGVNEKRMYIMFSQLNALGQQKALDYLSDLTEIYKNEYASSSIQKNA